MIVPRGERIEGDLLLEFDDGLLGCLAAFPGVRKFVERYKAISQALIAGPKRTEFALCIAGPQARARRTIECHRNRW